MPGADPAVIQIDPEELADARWMGLEEIKARREGEEDKGNSLDGKVSSPRTTMNPRDSAPPPVPMGAPSAQCCPLTVRVATVRMPRGTVCMHGRSRTPTLR